MSQVIRIILAIATLMLTIIFIGVAAFAVSIAKWNVVLICLLLALGLGFFNIIDYKHFFGAGENDGSAEN